LGEFTVEELVSNDDEVFVNFTGKPNGTGDPIIACPDVINDLAGRVTYRYDVQETSTFCHAFLDEKFYLATGHSACVSAENFNADIGRKIAAENVAKPMRDKLWELEGYALYKQLSV